MALDPASEAYATDRFEVVVGRATVRLMEPAETIRALELALKYSQERRTFGKPIAESDIDGIYPRT